jgi:hypothetical protein
MKDTSGIWAVSMILGAFLGIVIIGIVNLIQRNADEDKTDSTTTQEPARFDLYVFIRNQERRRREQ